MADTATTSSGSITHAGMRLHCLQNKRAANRECAAKNRHDSTDNTFSVWHVKGIVTCAHPQFIRDQDEFVSSSGLEKCVSAMDALQWMGAVRMRDPNPALNYYGIWVKNVLMLDLFHLLSSPDVNWWIIEMFLSHSDGTHSLQSIHCWDISPNLMKKQALYRVKTLRSKLLNQTLKAEFSFYSFASLLIKMTEGTKWNQFFFSY